MKGIISSGSIWITKDIQQIATIAVELAIVTRHPIFSTTMAHRDDHRKQIHARAQLIAGSARVEHAMAWIEDDEWHQNALLVDAGALSLQPVRTAIFPMIRSEDENGVVQKVRRILTHERSNVAMHHVLYFHASAESKV